MIDNGKALYSLQKFLILQTKLNPQTSDLIPDDYAYAWYVGLYPFFSECEWHENLKEYFTIKEEKIDAILEYLDKEWLEKRYYTYYEIEKYFNVLYSRNDITRGDLISILRYTYLHGGFDDQFWGKLLEPMKYPSEARIITYKFDTADLYLV
jgi:hypothetical protein